MEMTDATSPLASLEPGMTFTYEQPLADWQEALGERSRVLTLQFIGESIAYSKRYIFVVVGISRGDQSWSPGHLFLDGQTVERSFGNVLQCIA